MRCLFVVDQIARYREVAVALQSHGAAMTLVKEFKLAEALAKNGRFDVLIVGTNAFASDSMRFLQRRRERRCPIFAVTCQPELQRTLVDSGADSTVVLPDDGNRLQLALSMLFGTVHGSAEANRSGRRRQNFGRPA
jgi:DNA-binding response OmpR family regulator